MMWQALKPALFFILFFKDEKTLTKLMADVQEAQEILNKHKTDNHVRNKYKEVWFL